MLKCQKSKSILKPMKSSWMENLSPVNQPRYYRWHSVISYFKGEVQMIIDQVVGNVEDMSTAGRHVERVYLSSDDLVKRIQRVTTDHGKEVGIRLKEPRDLIDGDILYMDDKNMIVLS